MSFGTKKLIKKKVPKAEMRLLGQEHAEYKGKQYEKFWIIIPSKIVKRLGWKRGQELEAEVKGDKLVIEKD